MKKLIKRLEELAVENERLSTENTELRKELLQEVRNKVFNELDEDEERPKTTSTYKELGSQPKELEEAKEILKDWRFGKCTYSSDEIDRAVETILTHIEKHKH